MDIEVARRPAGGTRHTALVRCVDETGARVPGAEVTIQAKNFHLLPVLAGEDGVARQEDIPVPLYAAVGRKPGYLDKVEVFGVVHSRVALRCPCAVTDSRVLRAWRGRGFVEADAAGRDGGARGGEGLPGR